MIGSRRPSNTDSIEVSNRTFKKVYDFKYLGVNIYRKSAMCVERN